MLGARHEMRLTWERAAARWTELLKDVGLYWLAEWT